jgi:hypothetical protein
MDKMDDKEIKQGIIKQVNNCVITGVLAGEIFETIKQMSFAICFMLSKLDEADSDKAILMHDYVIDSIRDYADVRRKYETRQFEKIVASIRKDIEL